MNSLLVCQYNFIILGFLLYARSISLFVHTLCVINACMLRPGQSNLSDHLSANLTLQKTIYTSKEGHGCRRARVVGGLGLNKKKTHHVLRELQ